MNKFPSLLRETGPHPNLWLTTIALNAIRLLFPSQSFPDPENWRIQRTVAVPSSETECGIKQAMNACNAQSYLSRGAEWH
jgi:hypothetical protein